MDCEYGDLIGLHRPAHINDAFSRRHPRMARLNRAKLFAPFAALAGFEDAVRAKETPYVPRHILDAQERRALDEALNRLYRVAATGALARRNRARARVVYFEVCVDPNHAARGRDGLYHAVEGVVQKVDPVNRLLVIDRRAIPFGDIDSICEC